MTEVSQELLQAISGMIANAIRESTAQVTADAEAAPTPQPRPPNFTMPPYHTADGTTISDYFTRFTWALNLSKVPVDLHAPYARVYMVAELNDALKILVSPINPETLTYSEIQSKLTDHFDATRNKYAESIKFRSVAQNPDEPIARFTLRLRQAATYCEYGTFLDRMLIEQLLAGLGSREMCDEIIARRPDTFTAAYEIAYALEATRNTSDQVKSSIAATTSDQVHRIGYEKPRTRRYGHEARPTYRSYTPSRQEDDDEPQQSNREPPGDDQPLCAGCGEPHSRIQGRFLDSNYRKCGKKGHIAKVCRSRSINQQVHQLDEEEPAVFIDNTHCFE